MPYIFDFYGQRKEVSKSAFYLTGTVDRLFDDMLEILGGRIKVSVFRRNWYQLVAFILFVIRLAHSRAQQDMHSDILAYMTDQSNPDSYLNAFNNSEYETLSRYDPVWLAGNVSASYEILWNLHIEAEKKGEDSSFVLNERLGQLLAGDSDDEPNLHDAFSFLNEKFEKGHVKLFEE